MKKILMLVASFTVIFNPLFLTSCSLFSQKNIFVEEKLNLLSDKIDLDCNEPYDADLMIETTSTYEIYNKTRPDSIRNLLKNRPDKIALAEKLERCSEKNLMKADKKAVEEFNEFTSSNSFKSYDEVANAVYKAVNAQFSFNDIIEKYVDIDKERQEQFKTIILRLYNVLAKLVGKDSATYLIFDLKVQKNSIGDKTLVVSIGFPDLTGGGELLSHVLFTRKIL